MAVIKDEKTNFFDKLNNLYKKNPQKFRSVMTLLIFALVIVIFVTFHLKKKEQEAYKSFIEAYFTYNQEMNSDTPGYDRIIAAYKKVIDTNEKSNYSIESLLTIADCYYNKNEYEKALDYYEKFLNRISKNNYLYFQALLSKAITLKNLNKESEATSIFNNLFTMKKVPSYIAAQAGLYLAISKETNGNIAEAKQILTDIKTKYKDKFWGEEALYNLQRLNFSAENSSIKQDTNAVDKINFTNIGYGAKK